MAITFGRVGINIEEYSRKMLQLIYHYYHKAYSLQTWEGGDLL